MSGLYDDEWARKWAHDNDPDWQDLAVEAGWISKEAAERLAEQVRYLKKRLDQVKAEQTRQVEYVRDRLPDHDQYVHDLTDWLTALVDRVEGAEKAKEAAYEAGRQAGEEAAWGEAYQEGLADAYNDVAGG